MPKKSRADRIADTIALVNADLNAGVPKRERIDYVTTADSTVSPFMLRRRTGILGLDLATGGGFPAGGPSQVAAPDGVGKNALCWQTIAECQRIYGEESAIGWCCTELPPDKPFGQLFGAVVPMSDDEIALENLARKRDNRPKLTKKQIARMQRSMGTFHIIERGSSAKRLEAVAQLVASNLFQIIVVDSLAALLTEAREGKPLDEEPQQSSEARLVTEFQKKLWGAYTPDEEGPNWTTLIGINQVRANRNAQAFGRKWTVGGAYALRHGKLVDVWLTKGKPIKGKKKTEDDEEEGKAQKLGRKVHWELAKGKAGCHDGPSGVVDYHYDSGWDLEKELVDTALRTGTVLKTGSRGTTPVYSLIDEEGEIIEEFVGRPDLYRAAYDEVWYHAVYDLVLRKEGISCIYQL